MLLISGRYVMFIMESIWKKTQIKKQKFMSIIMLRCNKSTSVALTQVSRWIIQNFMRAKAFERRSASCINNHLSLFFSPSSNVLQESDGDIQSSWGSWQRHLGITCTSWVSGRETERRESVTISWIAKLVPTDDVYTIMKFLYSKGGRTSSTNAYTSALDTGTRCVHMKKRRSSRECSVCFLHSGVDRQEWKKVVKKRAKATTQLTTLIHTHYIG